MSVFIPFPDSPVLLLFPRWVSGENIHVCHRSAPYPPSYPIHHPCQNVGKKYASGSVIFHGSHEVKLPFVLWTQRASNSSEGPTGLWGPLLNAHTKGRAHCKRIAGMAEPTPSKQTNKQTNKHTHTHTQNKPAEMISN